MKLSQWVLATAAMAAPSTAAFSMLTPRFAEFPQRFGSYLRELDEMLEPDWPSTVFEKRWKQAEDAMFRRASPRYEIIDQPDKFEVSIHIPGFRAEDIDISLKAAGRLLTITGSHEEKKDDGMFTSTMKFVQNFSLDPSILTDQMVADFKEDGILVVSAPRVVERLPESRKIPIKLLGMSESSSKAPQGMVMESSHDMGKKEEARENPQNMGKKQGAKMKP
jgi:HSP20 family molecular chaperone IbpA